MKEYEEVYDMISIRIRREIYVFGIGKKVFNKLVKEDKKNLIRNQFKDIFIWIDKRLYYRGFLKVYKYILQKTIFEYTGPDYGYRYCEFLDWVRAQYIVTALTSQKGFTIQDEDMAKSIEYIRENGFDMYGGNLAGVHIYSEKDIEYDEKNGLFYGMYEGKKYISAKNLIRKEKRWII